MNHTGTQPIETARLLLRRFAPDDAEAMYTGWASDPEVTRWLRWQPHQSMAETRALLERWAADYARPDRYHWAIVLKETGRPIGAVGIFPGSDGVPADSWEPGYCLGRQWWGKGYTTEALRAAMDAFTAATGVRLMHCCHAVGNPASGRVMENAGFVYTHEGVYHQPGGTEVPARYYVWRAGRAGTADDAKITAEPGGITQ